MKCFVSRSPCAFEAVRERARGRERERASLGNQRRGLLENHNHITGLDSHLLCLTRLHIHSENINNWNIVLLLVNRSEIQRRYNSVGLISWSFHASL